MCLLLSVCMLPPETTTVVEIPGQAAKTACKELHLVSGYEGMVVCMCVSCMSILRFSRKKSAMEHVKESFPRNSEPCRTLFCTSGSVDFVWTLDCLCEM